MTGATAAGKYAAFARIAIAQARQDRAELYGRVVFFAVILGVFSSLWRATREAGLGVGDPARLVWYLAFTEWVLLSAPLVHFDLQEAIRRGDVACQLGRPVSFVGAALADGLGVLLARAPLLAATAFVCAFALTGWVPPASTLATVAVFGTVASALLTALYVGIGLLAFWLDDVSPVFWVWQKLLFVLGGLMLPIRLYPDVVRRIADLTPFPAILAGPASFVLDGGGITAGALGARLAVWWGVTVVTVCWLFRRAVNAMTVNGG
jgi:viologen exporter family transport system permease protein